MEKSSLFLTRLKKRRQFLKATHNGKKFVSSTMILQVVKQSEVEGVRLGFTVTKKMGNAVVRNRIRRRLRAVAQKIFLDHALSGYDYVLIARKAAFSEPFEILNRDLSYLLRQFKKTLLEQKENFIEEMNEDVNV